MLTYIIGALGSLLLLGYLFTASEDVQLIQLEGLILVTGGTAAAGLMAFSKERWKAFFQGLKICSIDAPERHQKRLEELTELNKVYFSNDLSKLERIAEKGEMNDPLNQILATSLVSGYKVADLEVLVSTHIKEFESFSDLAARTSKQLGAFAPGFGMLGTIYGLIKMLAGMGTGGVEVLGIGMSVALLTTFYGVILAQMLFIPLSIFIEEKAESETSFRKKYCHVAKWVFEKVDPVDLDERIQEIRRNEKAEK